MSQELEPEIFIQFEECEKQLLQLLDEEKAAEHEVTRASTLVEQLEGYMCGVVSRPSSVSLTTQLVLVKKVLALCRQGEVTGNSLFQALGNQLKNLFKATYSLLKSCLDTKLLEPSLQLDTLTEITAVASLSLYFDPSLLALCWRGVGKVCCSSIGTQEATLPHVIAQLCQAIVALTNQSTLEGDPLLEKRLKSGRFLGSLMLRLVSRFPLSFEECGQQLVEMLLATHQDIHATSNITLRSKLESSLLLLHEPLIKSLASSMNFIHFLLEPCSVHSDQYYGWLLCLTALLKHLSDGGLRYCLEAVSSREEVSCRALDRIFQCLDECHLELSMSCPVAPVFCNGRQCAISLYEWVCSHVCVAVSDLPMDLFQHVEKYLLSRLFTCHSFSAHLALDCLTFIARLGGEPLVYAYCQITMDILEPLPPSPSHAYPVLLVGSLLNRCLGLLPSAAQLGLLSSCDCFHLIWFHLQSQCLHRDTVQILALKLTSNATTALVDSHSVEDVVAALCCLLALVSSGEVQVGTLSKILLQYSSREVPYCLEVSLDLLCGLLPSLPPANVSEVLTGLSELANSPPCSLSLTLALCCVLRCLASLNFHPSIQEASMISLSRSYFFLLCVDHWLVRHHVLEAFRTFAEVCPHATAVESCVPSPMTNVVIDFLHKMPYRDHVYQERLHWCVGLSHPNHLLTSTNLPTTHSGDKIIRDLGKSWEKVKTSKQELSTASLRYLATLNTSISSFLAKHS